jgi:hypothetical protein
VRRAPTKWPAIAESLRNTALEFEFDTMKVYVPSAQ